MSRGPTPSTPPPSPTPPQSVVRVAVPVPLRQCFDYAVPPGSELPPVGARVRLPFGPRRLVGVVVEHPAQPADVALKAIDEVLDPVSVFPRDLFDLLEWAARYYHHPPGEVYATALPSRLRSGADPAQFEPEHFSLAQPESSDDEQSRGQSIAVRAPRQAAVVDFVRNAGGSASAVALREAGFERRIVNALLDKGLLTPTPAEGTPYLPQPSPISLNPEQEDACNAICDDLMRFHCVLLDGVTGSGKTEVYLRCIRAALERGGQALVLIPEISLTPQTLARFSARFGAVDAFHSGLSDLRRAEVWQACRSGRTRVLIGTRSAVFAPFKQLSLIVVDEEHDGSFKQQDGFRYSARDLAAKRCQLLSIPLLLGSATPSLESLRNADQGRYQRKALNRRAGVAEVPTQRIIDMRGQRATDGLSDDLVRGVRAQLEQGNQALLFINRRGFAPTLMCTGCGWIGECPACDARATIHLNPPRLRCHHCGWQARAPEMCPGCTRRDLLPLGTGTQRAELAVQELFPDVEVLRIDRDVTRSAARLEAQLARIHSGAPAVLVGTQMLAKGHHFPAVTLVGIVNADAGLFSADFKAPEHTAQLIVQVAGRAGREQRRGEVWIQTHNPEHPILTALEHGGYPGFAQAELTARKQADLPPFRAMALLRAEAQEEGPARKTLADIISPLAGSTDIEIWGPVPAPMARRADRHRLQCVLIGARGPLHRALGRALAHADGQRYPKVRWSVDVDPHDLI